MAKYKHYKGGIYELLYIAEHSETGDKLVIYKNNENKIYARPYDLFFETLKINGQEIERFKKISDTE